MRGYPTVGRFARSRRSGNPGCQGSGCWDPRRGGARPATRAKGLGHDSGDVLGLVTDQPCREPEDASAFDDELVLAEGVVLAGLYVRVGCAIDLDRESVLLVVRVEVAGPRRPYEPALPSRAGQASPIRQAREVMLRQRLDAACGVSDRLADQALTACDQSYVERGQRLIRSHPTLSDHSEDDRTRLPLAIRPRRCIDQRSRRRGARRHPLAHVRSGEDLRAVQDGEATRRSSPTCRDEDVRPRRHEAVEPIEMEGRHSGDEGMVGSREDRQPHALAPGKWAVVHDDDSRVGLRPGAAIDQATHRRGPVELHRVVTAEHAIVRGLDVAHRQRVGQYLDAFGPPADICGQRRSSQWVGIRPASPLPANYPTSASAGSVPMSGNPDEGRGSGGGGVGLEGEADRVDAVPQVHRVAVLLALEDVPEV